MIDTYAPRINRRTTLQWIATALAASAFPGGYMSAASHRTSKGYGTDPDLNHTVTPWERTMTPAQLQAVAVLADLILPSTDTAPAPSDLGIPDFIDEWVSAPYPDQRRDRDVIFTGLEWIDAETQYRWNKSFMDAGDSCRREVLNAIARGAHEGSPAPQYLFFDRLRFLVVGAYYTTEQGFKDVGYLGNVPLPSYPPVSEAEKAILDEELRKLGI